MRASVKRKGGNSPAIRSSERLPLRGRIRTPVHNIEGHKPTAKVERALADLGIPILPSASRSLKNRIKRSVKDSAKQVLFFIYRIGQRVGWNILPLHYYTSEPDIALLEHQKSFWIGPSPMKGVKIPLPRQIELLKKVCLPFRDEFHSNLALQAGISGGFGPGYGAIEAQCLHSVVRFFKPEKIIEVGSGVSTVCSISAAKINQQENSKRGFHLTCIEPFPKSSLLQLAGRENGISIRKEFVQGTPLDLFRQLKKNDILFIDSSHVVKTGSDVTHLVLEILPILSSGVLVHIHDIYLPYEYQRDILKTFIHSNETPLVHAFLLFNEKYEVMFSLSHLHYAAPDRLKEIFPIYRPQPSNEGLEEKKRKADEHFPSSIWLRVG